MASQKRQLLQYQLRFAMATPGDPGTLAELARTHLTVDSRGKGGNAFDMMNIMNEPNRGDLKTVKVL